ncbi:XRE family transcriptional regulator [Mariprofundus erugo]|uniref:helix-turn-helix domain-containing protein n=1 Tax=Mariprofundus erugo TaxID=2528639 RepID=UPI0010FE902B|nr:helix-turn-helix domain-containing protein [Mariprofundus erugo]TLS76957.1 XRE family transcriptional regulator [Mariprofundus erugo]
MDNTRAALETLKRALKLNSVTYADVAVHLGMSEASVKKMFSTGHFTLRRIDMICDMIGMDFIDLVRLFDQQRHRISSLTIEQEKELVADKRLFLVAVCARNHWCFDEILAAFTFTRAELFHYLARLEELKLLELHPNNRIKLRVAEDFRWLPRGPIEVYFMRHLLGEFLDAEFDQDKEMRLYLHGQLTTAGRETLLRRLHGLAHEFAELRKEGETVSIRERHNVGLFLALRDWEPLIFSRQRKQDTI